MVKWRKRPVEIEDEQWTCSERAVRGMCSDEHCNLHIGVPHVHTIHNNQVVKLEIGDFIVPEPDGVHFYPVKPDIFHNTYEKIS